MSSSFDNKRQLEMAIRRSRNLLLHPLFNCTGPRGQAVTVSLYECDPFVTKIDEGTGKNR